jgi:archaemetzincin
VGPVGCDILNRLAEQISNRCGLASRVLPGSEEPQYALNAQRGQYDSKVILRRLVECCPRDAVRILGVTQVDLFVPILKYVFGLAEVQGRCCLISTHRLRPEFYESSANPPLLGERVEKTALHELGHTMGLTHCRDRRCVMFSSTHIENTDQKGSGFCPSCLDLFRWSLARAVKNLGPG